MKHLIVACIGLLAAVIILGGVQGIAARLAEPTYAELVADQVRADRLQREAELDAAWAPWRAFFVAAVVVVVTIGLLAYLALLAAAHVMRVRFERVPNRAGLLPVAAADQRTAQAALAGYHLARVEEARRPMVPHALTYHAPHYRGEASALLPGDVAPPAALVAVPAFGELLAAGRVGKGAPLLLGFEAESGAELAGSWLDLYATATAGLPGSGKTTSQRFFAAQTALHGAQFVVCDPHAGAADDSLAATLAPLASRFLVEPADSPKAILEAVRYVAHIGEARVHGRDKDTTPIILWVDELTGLLGRSDVGDELAGLLERIAQEYRKRFVYLSASGQIWTAARATSELRDSLASVLCHRMKRSQARLLLPTDEAATVERLATGEAVLWRTSGQTARVRIPNTTADDVRRVAALLTDDAATMPRVAASPTARVQPAVSQFAPADYSALGRGAAPSAEAARVVALFLGGQDAGAIVTTLTGMTSKAGAPYLRKLAEVQAMIRDAMKGGQP